jgi:hypothetical protein
MSSRRGTGQGCWASLGTLAREVGCDLPAVSKAISNLAQRGYLMREPHPMDKRKLVLRVRYDDDIVVLGDNNQPVEMVVPDDNEPVEMVVSDDNEPVEMVVSDDNEPPKVVVSPQSQDVENALESERNIFRETGKDISLSDERNSAKAALRSAARGLAVGKNESRFGAQLGQTEREMTAGKYNDRLPEVEEYLWQIVEHATADGDNLSANWAMRLIDACGRQQELIGVQHSEAPQTHSAQ